MFTDQPKLEVIHRGPRAGEALHPTPIVLVHGAFVGAWCWEPHFLDFFAAQGFNVIAPSLRGHGDSGGRRLLNFAGISDYVDDLLSVVEGLEGPAPIFIGHSMGALVVQRYLEHAPASGAVLMAPVPAHGLAPSSLRMLMGDPLLFTEFGLMQAFGTGAMNADIGQRAVFSDHLTTEEMAAYSARVQQESQRALWEMNLNPWPRPWRVANKPPLLVLAGSDDALFTPTEVSGTATLWGADWLEIPDIAHAMMLEPNWHTVADAISRWLWARAIH